MRKEVQILLLAMSLVALTALVGWLFEWLVLPHLPAGLQNHLVAFTAALVLAVGILAGIAQISGYSLRDLLSREDAILPFARRSVNIFGDLVQGDKAGGDKVMRDKVQAPGPDPRSAPYSRRPRNHSRFHDAAALWRWLMLGILRLARPSPKHVRWLKLGSKERDDEEPALFHWLGVAGLTFNPFGPEKAEHDSLLEKFRVDAHFEGARKRRPVLIFGAPGAGKTAAAFLLALDCASPPEHSREAWALPVYYEPPLNIALGYARQEHLKAIAKAMADTIARYLTHHEEEYPRLSKHRRRSVDRLFALWSDSPEDLENKLLGAGPDSNTGHHLIETVLLQCQDTVPGELSEDKYLNIITYALPPRFQCVYLLADIPGSICKASISPEVFSALRALIDLIDPLKKRGLYLKLFLPDCLRDGLGDLANYSYDIVPLTWKSEHLASMLDARIRAAGGDTLMALCSQDVASEPTVDQRLVQAANGSPRQLVRLGNQLLKLHAKQAKSIAEISHEEIAAVLGPFEQADSK